MGERLRRARISAGYQEQVDLSRALDMGNSLTVNRWERKGVKPSPEYLPRLCKLLGVSESWLLYGVDSASGARAATSDSLHAVESYLASDMGRDCPKQVATLLMAFDFRTVGVTRPGMRDVHRIREAIEINLAVGKMPRDG